MRIKLAEMVEQIMITTFFCVLSSNDDDDMELFDKDDANVNVMSMKNNGNNEIDENDVSLFGSGEHDVPSC